MDADLVRIAATPPTDFRVSESEMRSMDAVDIRERRDEADQVFTAARQGASSVGGAGGLAGNVVVGWIQDIFYSIGTRSANAREFGSGGEISDAYAVVGSMLFENAPVIGSGEKAISGTAIDDRGGGVVQLSGLQRAGYGALAGVEFVGMVAGARAPSASPTSTIGRIDDVVETAGQRMAEVRRLGQQGERLTAKTRIRIPGSNRVRLPDGLTATELREVKNVKSLSYTQQMHDFVDYSRATGRQFILDVRQGTRLTAPLQTAVDDGLITLRRSLP